MTTPAFPSVLPNETTTISKPLRLAVLISGGGTTLTNLVKRIHDGSLNATVALVVASRPDCGGISRSAEAGLKCEVVPRKAYSSVADFSEDVFARCREAKVDLVICGGFLCLLKIPVDYSHRVMNIHPALIPAFCGKGFHGHHVHEAVLERGVKVSGCTVHFVDDEYDHGPIILQKVVPVLPDDTPDDLAARVFAAECEAYPEAINLFAAGRIKLDGPRTKVR